ncbi:hypothetical protein BDZ89DRAFT_1116607 [Hymenopellis radicata]|nr:hypothetical protein BDZ89DRAFT_1116607 [Hymenopellis radicata]
MPKPSSTVGINALNELNPPPDTAGAKQQTKIVFSNQSVPMAGEWSKYPAILDWNIGFYSYKVDSESRACFVMVHSGTTQTIIDNVQLTHMITYVGGGSGTFDNHLPGASEESSGDLYQYKINFSQILSLTKTDTNTFTFTAKYGDQFTRRGFVQSGTYDDDQAVFTLKKAINSNYADFNRGDGPHVRAIPLRYFGDVSYVSTDIGV